MEQEREKRRTGALPVQTVPAEPAIAEEAGQRLSGDLEAAATQQAIWEQKLALVTSQILAKGVLSPTAEVAQQRNDERRQQTGQ